MKLEDLVNSIVRHSGEAPDEKLEAFEEACEINLSEIYKQLVRKTDGAYFGDVYIDCYNPETGGKHTLDVGFYAYCADAPPYNQIQRIQKMWEPLPDNLTIFASSGGGDFICFDNRVKRKKEPKIVVALHDSFDKEGSPLVCPVAKNFEEFVQKLYIHIDPEELEYREKLKTTSGLSSSS